jgi:curli biogenesis system outer membrane secretion channel CsgG
MVRLFSILCILSISSADTKTVAISKGLADMLITDISNVKSLKIVEREKLESLLKEIGLDE